MGLGWPPDAFWSATPADCDFHFHGWARVQGIDLDGTAERDKQLDELMASIPRETKSIRNQPGARTFGAKDAPRPSGRKSKEQKRQSQ